LFGFDVITRCDSQTHSIIDINYFPGYIGVEDFNKKLFDLLISQIQNYFKIPFVVYLAGGQRIGKEPLGLVNPVKSSISLAS